MPSYYCALLFLISISSSAIGKYLANFDDLYYECPQGWLPYGNGQCIQRSNIKLDFDSAQRFCEQNSSHLVTIPTNPQRLAIDHYLLYDDTINETYWFGMQRNQYGRFHWITDKHITVGKFYWAADEPSNITTDQCGVLDKLVDQPGIWRLGNCSEQRLFICQRKGIRSSFNRMMAPAQEGTVNKNCPGNWTQHGNLCFRRFFNPEWFIHARSICQYYGADLGVIDSMNTQQQIDQFLGKEWLMWTWIGLYRDTSVDNSPFKWVVNGRETTYFNWAAGHPLPDRNCAVLKRNVGPNGVDWKWHSLDCLGKFSSFLCMKNLNDSYPSDNYKDLTQNLTKTNIYNVSTSAALNASETIGSALAQNLASIQSPISSSAFSQTAKLYIVSKSEVVEDKSGSIKINMTSANNYLSRSTIRHIEIPKAIVPKEYKGYVGIVSIAFQPTERNFTANGTALNHSIVSLNVYPTITEQFPKPVHLVFDITEDEKNSNIQCVYWKASSNNTGHWSTQGVKTKVSNTSSVYCETEHLSSFTVLVGMRQAKYISYLGNKNNINLCICPVSWKLIEITPDSSESPEGY
ncbi:uncharacterized protein TRIADDRAFT_59354 [Trichoplax adhaerens]|uniref:C-type lectin domain-containing protein n=1 Tax=Trichoplax adhaerens TaxID=10228 RepID=B3S4U9_TRIAD|nr:hypothetical protein TRIADDRAFT_59354 [Trichoplax adhaerens]EDV22273.1 hypothetical protein TRIADDRAFT_59354 [Trichoplax adhaerens]|eukprot:XP_002115428.1 hypothetical protein TRIADDRAFT_59354 [Trichoplax adhaerens]